MIHLMAKMTKKHKLIAYLLNRDEDFGYSQEKIATLMGVSQSTISNAVKEIEYLRRISNLEKALSQARMELIQQGVLPSAFPKLNV